MSKKPKKYHFHAEWEEEYFFTTIADKNICLICNSTVACAKKANIARHFNTLHKNYEFDFPLHSELRRRTVSELKTNLHELHMFLDTKPRNKTNASIVASYRVSRVIVKKKKPFEDGNVIKEAFLEAAGPLFDTFENKAEIIDRIKSIDLSAKLVGERIQMMAEDVIEQLNYDLNSCIYFSFQFHGSMDATDTTQFNIFARMVFDDCSIKEDLLKVLTFQGRIAGEDMYFAFKNFIDGSHLPIHKLVAIITDGTPRMVSEDAGLITLCKMDADFPSFLHYNSIIHHQTLCGKISNLRDVMNTVVKIVNSIFASAPERRFFKSLLKEINMQYGETMQGNELRWFSKGKVLQQFRDLLTPIKTFLKSRNEHYHQLYDSIWLLDLAFLTDLTAKLNEVNFKLQPTDVSVMELISSIHIFQQRLKMWIAQLLQKDLTEFPNLLAELIIQEEKDETVYECDKYAGHMGEIQAEIQNIVSDFEAIEPIINFISCPFLAAELEEIAEHMGNVFGMDKVDLENEIIKLQNDIQLKSRFADTNFWTLVDKSKYPNVKSVALHLKAIFGSTRLCGSVFSDMKIIKSKYRSRITNAQLDDCIKLAVTTYTPNYDKLAGDSENNLSA